MRYERTLLTLSLLLIALLPAGAQYRRQYPLPTPGVPASLGVNIHFTDPRAGEMEQLAGAGFRWIRMDFAWDGTERVRGTYDFAPYDRLMASLEQHKIRPIFILDYGNDLYQEGSPRTEESRAAFARWAAAAVTHFKGRGVLWEMWNEPNIAFWKPTPNVDEYIALAIATGKAIRQAQPEEWYIGPGVSGMDFTFLEKCFRAGLLNYWDAVSFHPYRNTPPESATPDFLHLRSLIAQYAPAKQIPILSSEWGYSEKYSGLDLDKQSKYIVRQALSNVANGLVVSIWYDWHDDGVDPKEIEHHFGTVYNDYKPKPTYQAMATLTQTLAGCRYNKRLALASNMDYCLLFSSATGPRLAVWTTDARPHSVRIPASAGAFRVIEYLGGESESRADTGGLQITLTDAPHYLIPRSGNALLETASHWRRLPTLAAIETPADVERALRDMTAGDWSAQDKVGFAAVTVRWKAGKSESEMSRRKFQSLGMAAQDVLPMGLLTGDSGIPYRAETPVPVRVTLEWRSGDVIRQEILLTAQHPLRIVPQPAVGAGIPIRIDNPTGAPFSGRARLTADAAGSSSRPLEIKPGQKEQTISLPVKIQADGSYRVGVRIEAPARTGKSARGWMTVNVAPEVVFRPLEGFAAFLSGSLRPASTYRVVPDGDAQVKSTIEMTLGPAPAGLSDPQARAVRIDYDFAPGWKFLRLEPEDKKRPLTGTPSALGVWVYGDGSGDVLNARFTDATGQTFQPTAGRIDWRGWRFVTFSLRGENSGHWGGSDDGTIHYPIHMDTLLLVDSPGGRGGKGTIYATGFTLMSPTQ